MFMIMKWSYDTCSFIHNYFIYPSNMYETKYNLYESYYGLKHNLNMKVVNILSSLTTIFKVNLLEL